MSSSPISSSRWNKAWSDLIESGDLKWKKSENQLVESVYPQLLKDKALEKNAHILFPCSGDCILIPFLYTQDEYNFSVVALELIPSAVDALKKRFPAKTEFTKEKHSWGMLHTSTDQRAKIYQVDLIKQDLASFMDKFDLIFDKDSFGAMTLDDREAYAKNMLSLMKPQSKYYFEVKHKPADSETGKVDTKQGPPFHVTNEIIETYFGKDLKLSKDYQELYQWTQENNGWKQFSSLW
eukprot:CAMPEP_0201552230 /NCGR_PEP_ID=MMETSP0173_2-20130828/14569_1 /ASSEMBLY_ACC=CAM_ASM_000268 /TAXON_ID=218659 /ORGANISM="Vexillifera sp., Strain DIVA3 564/2" /LENGTH=236 /DNA_ID=CAMNT_0047962673 /DNA_START=79 /DNA_END=786 /DNA_ORIENTATION=-